MITDVPTDAAERARRTWDELQAEARAVAERVKESWAAMEAEARAAEERARESWAAIEAANAPDRLAPGSARASEGR
jgi:hypothetical protein